MSVILPVRGIAPQFGEDCFLAPNATVVGEVIMGNQCSVWFSAVVRGDVNSIHIGNNVNVQDGAIIHGTFEKAATVIGDNVSIGHRAIVHGCTLHDNVLVGMGAIIMDNAVVHKNALVAAGAVVLENTVIESGTIWAGVPAKKVKALDAEKFADLNSRIANNYVQYSAWFKEDNNGL